MSKTFTYTKVLTRAYDSKRDDYEEYGCEFDYEVDNEDLLDAVVDLLIEEYFESIDVTNNVRQKLRCMITDFDMLDEFADAYEDSLKEMFEEEALESYED